MDGAGSIPARWKMIVSAQALREREAWYGDMHGNMLSGVADVNPRFWVRTRRRKARTGKTVNLRHLAAEEPRRTSRKERRKRRKVCVVPN